MKFEDIFDEDGLYVAQGFARGFAYRIHRGELTYVNYESMDDTKPYLEDRVKLAKYLIQLSFTKVDGIKDLF